MGQQRVSVVLITFNDARYLPRCLEGVRNQRGVELELVHVDNASKDGAADRVRELFPAAIQIRNDSNRGFAAAANQGIARASAEWVALLNADVRLEPDYLARLVEAIAAAGERCGSATGKLRKAAGDAIEPTELIDSKGIRMTRNGRHFDIDQGSPDVPGDRQREVFGPSGAAALFRREMLRDISVAGETFDERFFAYREDADLAWRAQLRGWSSLYVPEAEAWHVRRVTPSVRKSLPPEINMHSVKNRFLLRINNQGRYLALRDLPRQLFRDLIVLAASLTVERSSLPAFRWLWQHRRELIERRRRVQKMRRVSDREIARWFE
jgi:GT2 family glycosyltransferase